jgi:hypothetical protein
MTMKERSIGEEIVERLKQFRFAGAEDFNRANR